MPVGAGSIKRAAKLNEEGNKTAPRKKADTTKVKAEVTKVKAEVAKVKKTEKRLGGDGPCRVTEELPIYLL